MKGSTNIFSSPSPGDTNGAKVAKTMLIDAQITKLTRDVEKLMGIAAQHGAKIKELVMTAANSVSQVEFMSAITTTRFQNLNVVKSIQQKPDEKEADESASVASVAVSKRGQLADDKEVNEVKQLKTIVSQLEQEIHQMNFRNGMESKKIESEMKISRKEFFELKNHITSLEKKLEDFANAVEEGGIATNVQFVDPNQKAPPPQRKSSFLGDFSIVDMSQLNTNQIVSSKIPHMSIEEEASEITDENTKTLQEGDSDSSLEQVVTTENTQHTTVSQSSAVPTHLSSEHCDINRASDQHVSDMKLLHEIKAETRIATDNSHLNQTPTNLTENSEVRRKSIQQPTLAVSAELSQSSAVNEGVMKSNMSHAIPNRHNEQEHQAPISISTSSKMSENEIRRKSVAHPVTANKEVPSVVARKASVSTSKSNRHTIVAKRKDVELVFDDDFPEKDDRFFQEENHKIAQAAFYTEQIKVKKEELFTDYREQSRLLFTKIVTMKQVEDLSRIMVNESTTTALNSVEGVLFGRFQERVFAALDKPQTLTTAAQTDVNSNDDKMVDNGGSDMSSPLTRATRRVSRINRSNSVAHGKGDKVVHDMALDLPSKSGSSSKRKTHIDKAPIKESDSLHDFDLSQTVLEEEVLPAAILETDSTDHVIVEEGNATAKRKQTRRPTTSQRGNREGEDSPVIIPDVGFRDSLPSEAEVSVFESISQLDPLTVKDLAASVSFIDLNTSANDEVKRWIDKKFTKLVGVMNERFGAIDEHNKHISDNCNRLLHETNRLHQEMNALQQNMQKLNGSNKALSIRVQEAMENFQDNLDPLTAAVGESQHNIDELEKMLVAVAQDLDKYKKEQEKLHQVIDKDLSHLRPKVNSVKDNIDLTRLAHANTNVSEFEMDALRKDMKHYASLYEVLYEKYEHAVGQLARFVDSKQAQLLPKSARDKLAAHMRTAVTSPRKTKGNNQVTPPSPTNATNAATNAVARMEVEEMFGKYASEMKHEIDMIKGAVRACLSFIEQKEVSTAVNNADLAVKSATNLIPPTQPNLPLKSPMRNRKLVSHPLDTHYSLHNKKITHDTVPSLMNGKYLSRPNVELNSLEEIDLKLRADALPHESTATHESLAPPIAKRPKVDSVHDKGSLKLAFPSTTDLEGPHSVSTLSMPPIDHTIYGEDPIQKIDPLAKEYQSIWYNDFGGVYQHPNVDSTDMAKHVE